MNVARTGPTVEPQGALRQCRAEHPASGRRPGDRIVACLLERGHLGEHEEVGTGITWSDPSAEPAQPPTASQRGDTLADWLEYRGLPPGTTLSELIAAERDTARLAGVFDHIAEERRKGALSGLTPEQTIRHHALAHAIEGGPYDPETAEILDLADVFAAYIRDGSHPA